MEIYKIINNINNKIYIGKTVTTAAKRWKSHIYEMQQGDNNAIHSAMRKYGVENFSYEIIQNNINDKEILSKKEKYYIQYFNSLVPNGYNIAPGGEGGNGLHAENLKKWREQHPEQLQKIIENLNSWRKQNPEKVKEANQKAVLTRKERYPNLTKNANEASKKKVICIETGEVFNSATEAAHAMNGANGAHVGQVCNGKRKTAYRKHWKWLE